MKRFKRGLVIGKFYPFHLGHQYLIETALKQCEKLTVIVCQTEKYKIPGTIRTDWIRRTFSDVEVRLLHHAPEMDSDSTDISQDWAKLTVDFLGYAPDVVFSSENYGEPYAKFMGSGHVLVDLDRRLVPISATKIRENILDNWDYLSMESKSYFGKRIVVVGAESTGTTTLAQDLARYYKTAWVPEYGRMYYEGKMTSMNINDWSTGEFLYIASIQNEAEENLAKQANRVLICDTNSFATELWHERYVGFMSKDVNKVISSRVPDLYILTNIDIPFVQDGTRDGEFQREHMHQRFIEEMEKRKYNYVVVSGNRERRLKNSVKRIDQITSSWEAVERKC